MDVTVSSHRYSTKKDKIKGSTYIRTVAHRDKNTLFSSFYPHLRTVITFDLTG